MGLAVCNGANLQCSFGTEPAAFTVLPDRMVTVSSQPMANIMDHKPMVNIMPLSMCTSLSNPAVAAATSAAMGVLTPQPCLPVTTAPWAPGSPTVLVSNQPALNSDSTLICQWGGVIQVVAPGQTQTMVP